MDDQRTPVLIIGGGLAGLTAATLLAWRGIPCLLVERHASTSRHPRARGVNLRSLEHLRQVPGLETDLAKAGRAGMDRFSMIIAESVTGREIKRLMEPGAWDTSRLSPAHLCIAGQDRVEPVLLDHARAQGAEVRFSSEVVDLVQDADGCTATLLDRDTREKTRVRADYVIAADGARSLTRARLGIATHGHGSMSHNVSIIFQADLGFLADRGFVLYYLQNPGFTGVFVTMDDPDRGQISVEYDPNRESVADFDAVRCASMVRAALGLPELDVTVLDSMCWEMTSRVAERMRAGRIFLAGDAAHTMPPTGGLGGQTAIQDGVDLAWKLAMVIHGHADPALLDTYEAERLPVAKLTVERQTQHYVERMRPDRTDLSSADAETDYIAVAMGYRYRSAAIQDDPTDDGTRAESPLRPTYRPGTRIGHVPLLRDGEPISSLDLVGPGFMLIAGRSGLAWIQAAARLAARGLPIVACRMGRDLVDRDDAFATAARLADHSAVLVRPDGFVAWRFDAAHADPETALDAALSRALRQAPLRPIACAA